MNARIYRDRNLQRKSRHFTEISPTFVKSVNSSSFPVGSGFWAPNGQNEFSLILTKEHVIWEN